MDLLRDSPTTSQIAQERVEPGLPGYGFLAFTAAIALAAAAVTAYLGDTSPGPLAAEKAAAAAPAGLLDSLGLAGARLASAAAAGATVAAASLAGRRLFHSDLVGLLAGALVALDPGFLAAGRTAVPDALLTAALMSAFALFLAVPPWTHWAASVLLALAAAAAPLSLVWSGPLALLALLRGHIYAAPRHLGRVALQVLAVPLVGVALHLAATRGQMAGLACAVPLPSAYGLAQTLDYGGVVALHNPVTWFGGLGALLFLGAASLAGVARQFRLARLPGRLQLRIAAPLEPAQGRTLWLLLFAILAPFPILLLPLLAIALAAGIGHLAEDAPGFGAAVALVVLLFAAMALARTWALVAGTASPEALPDLLGLVPWTRTLPCA